jgi:hypothetical protein
VLLYAHKEANTVLPTNRNSNPNPINPKATVDDKATAEKSNS